MLELVSTRPFEQSEDSEFGQRSGNCVGCDLVVRDVGGGFGASERDDFEEGVVMVVVAGRLNKAKGENKDEGLMVIVMKNIY